ncbi:hypothetical protein E4T56_gene13472 [Termitomyces sp. T112]|nr:hypothetical protein E4T56_gene13472 [Termitomyces sp. T112]
MGVVLPQQSKQDVGPSAFIKMIPEDVGDKAVEVGDQIYTTTLCSPPSNMEIWASIPICHAFHTLEDVFSKALFDLLPECKQWDHTIELMPDSKLSSCKVYSLVPKEQNELDTFLQENLNSGCICPSKSSMAFLDYQVLNAITVKNCYPLLLISELISNLWSIQYFTKLDIQWGYNNMHI